MEEEVKTETSASTTSEADSQTMQDAILGASRVAGETKETTDESVKETGTETELRTEPEPTPLTEEETQIAKTLERFKQDPKEVAKAYLNLQNLQSRHDTELGETRRQAIEYYNLRQRMINTPQDVIKELSTLVSQETDQRSLLERALEDETVLDKTIEQKVAEKISQHTMAQQRKEETLRDLRETYGEDFDQTVDVRDNLRQVLPMGNIPVEEFLYWAAKGYTAQKEIEQAKKLGAEEYKQALTKKMGQQLVKGQAPIKEIKEPSDSEVLTDIYLNLRR
jgi:hypothetical protein